MTCALCKEPTEYLFDLPICNDLVCHDCYEHHLTECAECRAEHDRQEHGDRLYHLLKDEGRI